MFLFRLKDNFDRCSKAFSSSAKAGSVRPRLCSQALYFAFMYSGLIIGSAGRESVICIDGGRCLMVSVLCCAAKLVGDAKLTEDVHPSEVESADSFNVFLPVAVANGIRTLGAVAVSEEVQELAGLSSSDPAGVVVADGGQADLSGFSSIGDFDRQYTVGSFSLGTTLHTVDGVSDAVGVESESV